MLGTISVILTNVTITGYFPQPLSVAEELVSDGAGTLTISFYPIPYPLPPPVPGPQPTPYAADAAASALAVVPRGTRYYLQLDAGNRVNALRLGQLVSVTGIDPQKKVVALATPLETVSVGTPAVFQGPTGVLPGPLNPVAGSG